MPARRSRTEQWRETLSQIAERGGAIEIALATPEGESNDYDADHSARKNLIWRVRVLALTSGEIIVEEPVVLRQRIHVAPGVELIGVIAVGPNRWMFRTTNLGQTTAPLGGGIQTGALRLAMPTLVERCQRRAFYRVSTVDMNLPAVVCAPLLDPSSAVAAETAIRAAVDDMSPGVIARIAPESPIMNPEIGPSFHATLVNIGGGGVGLLVEQQDASGLDRHRNFWLRIDLTPHMTTPLGVCTRLAHTHIDVSKRTYAGMSFEFGHNAAYEKFVIEQVCRYVAEVQREQLRRRGGRDVG